MGTRPSFAMFSAPKSLWYRDAAEVHHCRCRRPALSGVVTWNLQKQLSILTVPTKSKTSGQKLKSLQFSLLPESRIDLTGRRPALSHHLSNSSSWSPEFPRRSKHSLNT